jgi:hypothetical protein
VHGDKTQRSSYNLKLAYEDQIEKLVLKDAVTAVLSPLSLDYPIIMEHSTALNALCDGISADVFARKNNPSGSMTQLRPLP